MSENRYALVLVYAINIRVVIWSPETAERFCGLTLSVIWASILYLLVALDVPLTTQISDIIFLLVVLSRCGTVYQLILLILVLLAAFDGHCVKLILVNF